MRRPPSCRTRYPAILEPATAEVSAYSRRVEPKSSCHRGRSTLGPEGRRATPRSLAGAWMVDSANAQERFLNADLMDEEWLQEETLQPRRARRLPGVVDAKDFAALNDDVSALQTLGQQPSDLPAVSVPLVKEHVARDRRRELTVMNALPFDRGKCRLAGVFVGPAVHRFHDVILVLVHQRASVFWGSCRRTIPGFRKFCTALLFLGTCLRPAQRVVGAWGF